ncbi:MAG: sialidase family protein [Halofilum sp. (in: g-proteobacteria)]|nr:sialidase family protein [Halofilum sp. (in: g-proteobacteria)]
MPVRAGDTRRYRGAMPGAKPAGTWHGSVAARTLAALALLALAAIAVRAPPARADSDLQWRAPVTVASGAGHRGPWRMNASVFDYVDDATVTWLAGGDAAVAWVDQARKDVFVQRYGPGGEARLPAPVNVSGSPGVFSWLPRLATAPGDPETLYVAWQEIVFSGVSHGGEIFFARSRDGGRSFGAPVNLSRSRAGDGKGRLFADYWHNGSLDLAVGPGGTVYVAWTEYEGPLRLARSRDGGTTFSAPTRIAGGAGEPPARAPALAAGDDGVVHLAWTVGEQRAADIRHARSEDAGRTFTRARRVDPGPGHADAPKLALGADGTLHLAYALSPDGPLRRYDLRYTRRPAGGDAFAPARTVSAPLPRGFEGAAFPHLALAGDGRVYLACELFSLRGPYPPDALGILYSRDGGDSFTDTAVVPRTAGAGINGSQQGLLMDKLAVAPDGAIALVNSKFRRGQGSHVRLLRAAPPPRAAAD